MAGPAKVFSIAPHGRFLDVLAEAILDGTLLGDWQRDNPFWLADVTVILPTRRARLVLAEAFVARGQVLLPDIRTFGGEVGDEEPFLPPLDAPNLKPPATLLERRLMLARLIESWARTPQGAEALATPPNAAEILALADSLAELVDDLAVEQLPAAALRAITPESLAANWQQTLRFLDIVLSAWPAILDERGKADPASLRNERLERQAAAAPLIYGERPVIAAGSTGSVLATADLLAAIADLPRGALVLPGFDMTLSPAERQTLLDVTQAPQSHPQYGLSKLHGRLGSPEVVELVPQDAPRTRIVRRAMALAEATAAWSVERQTFSPAEVEAATAPIAIMTARTEDEEARAIALAVRDGLAEGQSVGIVTPDRNLARRIAAELCRFEIEIDDSAGTPLFQSSAGRFVRQVLAVAAGGFAAVDLMALLHHGATCLGFDRQEIVARAHLLELGLLRGQRIGNGLAGLRAALDQHLAGRNSHPVRRLTQADGQALSQLFDALDAALTPLCDLLGEKMIDAGAFARALANAFARARSGPDAPQSLAGEDEFIAWAEELRLCDGQCPPFAPTGLDSVLFGLMAGVAVRSKAPHRTDIALWGTIEARLMSPDLMILCGLNEDIWPEPADPGPWLSRGMRIAAGLEPPERFHGLAAHDFEMALGNRNVVLAYSERVGTAPALPSRLLQRLEAFLGEDAARAMRARGRRWTQEAQAIDATGPAEPARRPAPNPTPDLRPRRLSVTEIETLFRSPYDIYARHVLGLRRLDPLGEDPGARERGSMIHAVFARFIEMGADPFADDAHAHLCAMAEEEFAGLDAIGERRDIWLRRFARAATLFLDYERERAGAIAERRAEVSGEWLLPSGFRLSGRADRLDRRIDGALDIIDFKTGTIPAGKVMQAFEAPQMLLEAAMARAGAFAGTAPAPIGSLTYIKIGLGPEAFVPTPFRLAEGFDLSAAADEASRRMQAHVEAFLYRSTPMAARIRPDLSRRYRGDYDHLARTDEWTLSEGSEP